MSRTLWLSLGILLVVGIITLAFGTLAPTTTQATPYYSALSHFAVSTAEACHCNQKICVVGNVCNPNPDPETPKACCFYQGNCQTVLCFP
jgi:hypothetical protein